MHTLSLHRRVRRFGWTVLALLTATAAATAHSWARRDAERATRAKRQALVGALGFADLALSSSVRWIRHPSQVEPNAARSDLPGALDVDPAGALVGPPEAP